MPRRETRHDIGRDLEFERKIERLARKKRRRPGDGSMPALVEPPRGPKPLAGGAAAPLESD